MVILTQDDNADGETNAKWTCGRHVQKKNVCKKIKIVINKSDKQFVFYGTKSFGNFSRLIISYHTYFDWNFEGWFGFLGGSNFRVDAGSDAQGEQDGAGIEARARNRADLALAVK